MQIISRPDRLRPSHEGLDPTSAIQISYRPTESAVHDAVLIVMLHWPDADETLRIPIRAAAHHRNQPTHAQVAADQERARRKAEADEQQHEAVNANEAEVAKLEKKGGGWDARIIDASEALRISVELLSVGSLERRLRLA